MTKTSDVKITKTEIIYETTMSQEDTEFALRRHANRSPESQVVFLYKSVDDGMGGEDFKPDGVIIRDFKITEVKE